MATKIEKEIRNNGIRVLLTECLDLAKANKYEPLIGSQLELTNNIFQTTEWGFREVLLLIVIVKLNDKSFDASNGFYTCNPRSVIENIIVPILNIYHIPCRKSGVLNVAKGVKCLNDDWASPRAIESKHLVALVNEINLLSPDALRGFAICICAKFLEIASSTLALTIVLPAISDPIILSKICLNLISIATDGGNTAQRIVGYALEAYHEQAETGVQIKGHLDRASTTSTTSKKLGDISEVNRSNVVMTVYEVTTKPFTLQRISEAYDAVRALSNGSDLPTASIIVLCKSSDVPDCVINGSVSHVFLGEYDFKSLRFYFINLFEWIAIQLLELTIDGRASFYIKLDNYIAETNTAVKVKTTWNELRKTFFL